MRKILICALFACSLLANGEEIRRNGKNFYVVKEKTHVVYTKYTYTDHDGKTYSIYIDTKSNKAYIIRLNKKGTKEVKKYLDDKIFKEICDEMGLKPQETKKKSVEN